MTDPYAAAEPAVRPRTVDAAYWLYVVGAVLGLIGAIVNFVALPAAIAAGRAAAERLGTSTRGVDVNAIATGSAIGAAVLSALLTLAFSVLILVFAPRMRRGRNWARITLAVIAGVQLFGIAGSYGVGALHFVVLLVALILSFLPASNAWFRAVRPQTAPA